MENKNQSSIIKNSVVLAIITLVAGLLLGLVYESTRMTIDARRMAQKQEDYQTAFLTAASFAEDASLTEALLALQTEWDTSGSSFGKVTLNEVLIAKDASGSTIGHIVSVTSGEGYAGDVVVAIGVSLEGTIEGIQILEMNETPGLGANASNPEFLNQYVGKQVPAFVVTKTGKTAEEEIDAISSATITSNAVTNAVNAGLSFLEANGNK